MIMRLTILPILSLLLLLSGCAPQPAPHFPAGLMGMIYDDYNNPVDGAEIKLTEGRTITSDIDGRFLLPSLYQGEYSLTMTKEGFEQEEITFKFQDPKQVLYVKMSSMEFLKEKIEHNLHEREWEKAFALLERAFKLDEGDPVVLYLAAIFHYQTEDFNSSAEYLEKLIQGGYRNGGVKKLKILIEAGNAENP